jgi:hypothetical protein
MKKTNEHAAEQKSSSVRFSLACGFFVAAVLISIWLSFFSSESSELRVSGSISFQMNSGFGSEERDQWGSYFWIVRPISQFDLVNNSPDLIRKKLKLNFQGNPCGTTQSIQLKFENGTKTLLISLSDEHEDDVDVVISPRSSMSFTLMTTDAECKTLGDPRLLYAKVYLS